MAIYNGYCGYYDEESVSWEYDDSTNIMTITGYDYTYSSNDWFPFDIVTANSIKMIIQADGGDLTVSSGFCDSIDCITSLEIRDTYDIDSGAFANCSNLTKVKILTSQNVNEEFNDITLEEYYAENVESNFMMCNKLENSSSDYKCIIKNCNNVSMDSYDTISCNELQFINCTFMDSSMLTQDSTIEKLSLIDCSETLASFQINVKEVYIDSTNSSSTPQLPGTCFYECRDLEKLTIIGNLDTNPEDFAYSGLKSITVKNGAVNFGEGAFRSLQSKCDFVADNASIYFDADVFAGDVLGNIIINENGSFTYNNGAFREMRYDFCFLPSNTTGSDSLFGEGYDEDTPIPIYTQKFRGLLGLSMADGVLRDRPGMTLIFLDNPNVSVNSTPDQIYYPTPTGGSRPYYLQIKYNGLPVKGFTDSPNPEYIDPIEGFTTTKVYIGGIQVN